jgi:hypothetical protein
MARAVAALSSAIRRNPDRDPYEILDAVTNQRR